MPSAAVDPDTVLPILGVRAGDVPPRLLVVGDPNRASRVAEEFDDATELGHNREYLTIAGYHRGHHVGVASHGVGSAGALVCFEELCRAGAQRLIRAGTAGGMQPHVVDGTLVIATAAVRNEGATPDLVPLGFPAVAAVEPTVALRDAALAASTTSGQPIELGVVLTNALFYPGDVLGQDLVLWQRAGVVAIEMEAAALFVTAALHGVEAGAVVAIDGNPLRDDDTDMSGYDPDRAVVTEAIERMIVVALGALTTDPPPAAR